jgi:hypothetical protein
MTLAWTETPTITDTPTPTATATAWPFPVLEAQVQGEPADGELQHRGCPRWNMCRGASVANAGWSDLEVTTVGASPWPEGGFLVQRTFLFFDTSAIPAGSVILKATLHFHTCQWLKGNTTIHLVRSTAHAPLSFNQLGHIQNLSGGWVTAQIPNAWTSLEFIQASLDWIRPGGVTALGLVHDLDLRSIEPESENNMCLYTADNEADAPYLTFTYAVPTSAFYSTASAAAVVTATHRASDWPQGIIAFALRSGTRHALYVQNLESGGEPHAVLLPTEDSGTYEGPVLSPDGTRLAFYTLNPDTQLLWLGQNSSPTYLASCIEPAWSPTNDHIVCRSAWSGHLWLISADSGEVYRSFSAVGHLPDWSPVEDEFVFTQLDEERSSTVWRFSLADTDPVLLAGTAFQNYMPSWSPDGQSIAFQSGPSERVGQIWIMHRDGRNPRQITFLGTYSRGPVWSPDGRWIGFVSDAAGGSGAYGEFFVVSLETGRTFQVTQTGGRVYEWRVSWRR